MNLLTDNIEHVFRRYMVTAFGSALITSIYSLVDMVCVGQFEGPAGSAALSCIAPIWSIFVSLGMLLGIGGSVRMSFCRGEGRKTDGDRYFTVSVLVSLFLSAVITAPALRFEEEIIRLFGADDSLIGVAMAYTHWLLPAIPIFLIGQVLIAFIRNDGAPGVSTAAILTGGLINIVLDVWFVFGLEMGAGGAGLATVLGQTVAFLILCSYFFRRRCALRLVHPIRFFRSALESIQAGFSPFLVDISYGISVAMFNNQIMRYGSAVELAVYGAAANIAITFQSLFYGVGQALQPIASINFGAKQLSRVQQVFRLAVRTAVCMSLLFFAVAELIPDVLLRIYMDVDASVLSVGPAIVRRHAAAFLLTGTNVVLSYYLQSVLQNGKSLLLSLSRGFLFCALFLYALPAIFGLDAIWWTMPLTEACTLLLAWFLLRKRHVFL